MKTENPADLFTGKSRAYAKYRPGYPPEAINVILNPFKNQRSIRVVDVGAGTGIASRLMANRGANVTAIEPNGEMIASATYHDLITYLQSTAEHTMVDTNFADIVTSFQAFHWFNFKQSLREFNRIIKPRGQLALVWSYLDERDTFTASYVKLINEAAQKNPVRSQPFTGIPGKLKKQRIRILWKFKYLPYFKHIKRHSFKFLKNMDLDQLIGCAKSQSQLIHEGAAWEELIKKLQFVHDHYPVCRLTYNIKVFLAKPVK